jgi:enoyl-CoA hydratase
MSEQPDPISEQPHALIEQREHVLIVTLTRPEARNALSTAMMALMPENDAFAIEAKLGMTVFASDDAKEGPRAFAEKRKPRFRDA